MTRSRRLFELIQLLRCHRYPVTAAFLASQLDVSVRTIYRDIETLQAQGADIEGDAGLGFVLRPGFMLPPLMFSDEELEALALGMSWVAERGDARLQQGAKNALAKVAAVLPVELKQALESSGLMVVGNNTPPDHVDVAQVRLAIRREHSITIEYCDVKEASSTRTIWPLLLGYFEQVRVLVAWCELRNSFRHFRVDRILSLQTSHVRYPKRRQILLQQWRAQECIATDKN